MVFPKLSHGAETQYIDQRIITSILREFICKTIACVNYKIRKISHGQRNALRKSSTLRRFEPAWVKFKLACDQYQPHRTASAFNHAVRWVCQLSQDYCYAELADNSLVTAETRLRWRGRPVEIPRRCTRETVAIHRATWTVDIDGRHSVSGTSSFPVFCDTIIVAASNCNRIGLNDWSVITSTLRSVTLLRAGLETSITVTAAVR